MAKRIDQTQLRNMHGKTLLQATKHFGRDIGTSSWNKEAYQHAYKAHENFNNHYHRLEENKEGHADHTAQAAKLRAAGDEKGAKIHEELASHYHRAQGIEVPKKARAPRASKDPLVQASKGRAAKAPEAGHAASHEPGESDVEHLEHAQEHARAAKEASAHAGTKQDGPSHKAAGEAHAKAAKTFRKAGDTNSAAAHEKLSELHHSEASKHGESAPKAKPSHAETMEGLHAKRADIAAKTASAKEKTAASKARTAGMHEELGKVHASKSAADEHNEGLKKKIGGLKRAVKKTEGAASKQEAANRKALRSSGEDDKHVPDHKLIGGAKEPAYAQAAPGPKTEAARAAQAKAKAERDEAEKSGDPKRIGAARKAHSEATATTAEAHKEEEGAQPKKPRAPRASKDPLVQASKGRRTRASAPREAGDAAAGAHVRANMAEGASKLEQNKALMGHSDAGGGDDKSKILAHMAKAPDDAHKFGDIKAATGMDHDRFSKALQGLEASGHLVSYNNRDWNDAKGAAEAKKEGDEHGIHRGGVKEEHPRVQARLDQYHPEVKKLLAEGAAAKGGPDAGSARETSGDKGATAQRAELGGRVAGVKERLAGSRERVAGMGKPTAPPTAAETHAAETQARRTAIAASHDDAFGKLHGAYSVLAQHHEIAARTAPDGATKASHANLAAHYGNTRDFTARANTGERFKDVNASEREHAGHAEAHRFAAKGAGHPSIAALHNNLAAHHDELQAHHVANRHGISLQDARKAIKDTNESLRRGGIRSRGEAHNFRTGKRGGWYFVNQHGVKVYAGKGHR